MGTNFTQKDVVEFLGLTDEDFNGGLHFELRRDEVDDSNYSNYCLLRAPSVDSAKEILQLNGKQHLGKDISVTLVTNDVPTPTFAEAAAKQVVRPAKRVVEIDCAPYFDCYKIPPTSTVVYAVSQQFKNDRTKKLFPLHSGRWALETGEVNHYLGVDDLMLNGERVAKLRLKKVFPEGSNRGEKETGENGEVNERNGTWDNRENDLLITLYKADTEKFDGISHEDLYQKIVAMNIGSIKKGITQQKYKDSDIPNGNLFFVLTDVDKERDFDKSHILLIF